VAALWTLDGLASTTPQLLREALGDPSAKVRSAAVRLHERWLGGAGEDEAVAQLAMIAGDPEPEVVVQLALSLGQGRSEGALVLMQRILEDSGDHPFISSAIVTGLRGRELEFFDRLAREASKHGPDPEMKTTLRLLVTAIIHQGDEQRLRDLVSAIGDPGQLPEWFRLAALEGFEPLLQPAFRRSIGTAHVAQSPELAPLCSSSDPKIQASATSLTERLAKVELAIREKQVAVRPFTKEETDLYEAGKITFQTCAACHQLNGGGLTNVAPSLVDSHWVAGNPEILVRIVLNGKEGTPGFPGAMPAIGGSFSDEQIAGVLTYIRNSWGLHEGAVSVTTVAKSRKDNRGRVADWTEMLLHSLESDLEGRSQ
jgi:mono/diheme cytochrome c family protein